MSSFLHPESGQRVLCEDWQELCETVRDTAEGFAATDPGIAWIYRAEAGEFCAQSEPNDVAEFSRREFEAALLRQSWSTRFRERRPH